MDLRRAPSQRRPRGLAGGAGLGLALALAGCGDDIAGPAACDTADYPLADRVVSASTQEPTPLPLDGSGPRCEQIERALRSPTARPAALAGFPIAEATATCRHDDALDREIVRLRADTTGGVPLYLRPADAVLHVDAAGRVVYLAASYLEPGLRAPAACLAAPAIAAAVDALPFTRFEGCAIAGAGAYAIAPGDRVEVGAEGLLVDDAGLVHLARPVDVHLAAAHVTAELARTDLYCCAGEPTDDCAGARVYVDALTGAVIARQPYCITC